MFGKFIEVLRDILLLVIIRHKHGSNRHEHSPFMARHEATQTTKACHTHHFFEIDMTLHLDHKRNMPFYIQYRGET